jgi:hypothetical protein
MGRPPAENPLDAKVFFRLDESDYRRAVELAREESERLGITLSVNAWARWIVRQAVAGHVRIERPGIKR